MSRINPVTHTAPRTKGKYRLLILDGHESHHSTEFELYCRQNNSITLCMPPHSSHKLQPLDVGCFGPLKQAYGRQIEDLMRAHINHVSKLEFLCAFREAFFATMTEKNIRSGFAGAGLVPYDPERMDQLDPDLVQRVNTKVSAVVERYLLDDQDLTPKNTRKAYGPKQAEWMEWCKSRFPEIPPGWPAQYQIGKALPGHLVDEGKLVLFLDEEIASRAPKRGKRRKAETQRLKTEGRQKRRKRESPFSTGAADEIVVGGGPAKDSDSKSEPDLDNMDPDPVSATGTSTLKLQYSTVRLYSSAIINLYAQQKTRGENPAPHPNGLAKKALMRHILRETACRSRNEWADRILNTIKDGYSPAKVPEHTAAAWRFSD
ncbi:DDE-domain-containing protein, partial [Parathielavia hyrcaniae]